MISLKRGINAVDFFLKETKNIWQCTKRTHLHPKTHLLAMLFWKTVVKRQNRDTQIML